MMIIGKTLIALSVQEVLSIKIKMKVGFISRPYRDIRKLQNQDEIREI